MDKKNYTDQSLQELSPDNLGHKNSLILTPSGQFWGILYKNHLCMYINFTEQNLELRICTIPQNKPFWSYDSEEV